MGFKEGLHKTVGFATAMASVPVGMGRGVYRAGQALNNGGGARDALDAYGDGVADTVVAAEEWGTENADDILKVAGLALSAGRSFHDLRRDSQ
jgi:hypothetical protein